MPTRTQRYQSEMQRAHTRAQRFQKLQRVRTWIRSAQPSSGNCSLMGVSRASALGRPASEQQRGEAQRGGLGGDVLGMHACMLSRHVMSLQAGFHASPGRRHTHAAGGLTARRKQLAHQLAAGQTHWRHGSSRA